MEKVNESLQVVSQIFELAEKILTRPNNLVKNAWVQRWLENRISTERFEEGMVVWKKEK